MIYYLLSGLFMLAVLLPADLQAQLPTKIDTPAVSMSIDNLDNIYIISAKNELLKFDAQGAFQSSYSNKNLQADFSVDVSDPLRIILYSPAFQQLTLLNNKLSEIFTYRFKDSSRRITLLAAAENNIGFWAFDENSRQLVRLGRDMREEHLSGDIFQISGININPHELAVSGQYIYLYDSDKGLMQFDRFGAYLQFFREKGGKNIQIKDNRLIRMHDGKLTVTDITDGETFVRNLPELSIRIEQAVLGNNAMVLRTPKSIFIFRQPSPEKLN